MTTAGNAMEMTWAVGTHEEGVAAAAVVAAGGVGEVVDYRVKTVLTENTTGAAAQVDAQFYPLFNARANAMELGVDWDWGKLRIIVETTAVWWGQGGKIVLMACSLYLESCFPVSKNKLYQRAGGSSAR